ncbi:MAG: anti-sigma factor family protein [Acidobacteriota bacterium]
MSCAVIGRDLDAYLDRELGSEPAAVVRNHLSGCAACRARVAEREALSRILQSAPYFAAPERLRARVSSLHAPSRLISRFAPWAAAAAVVLAVAAAIVFLKPTGMPDQELVAEVVDAHVRSLMADHLFDVKSTDQHTVKPWFLGKLDFAPPVTDLASAGFPLLGGRLDYLDGRAAAALVYERRKHTINVFALPARDGAALPAEGRSLRGFHVYHWNREGMSLWAVSDLNDAELKEFVRAIRER